MTRYIFVRLIQGLITLFVLATFVFVLARLIGDPVSLMLPDNATAEMKEMMTRRLGLDQPYYIQYGEFILALIKGDFGHSFKFDQPVLDLFLQFFPNTLKLVAVTFTIAMVFGLTMGLVSGTHRNSFVDHITQGLSVVGMSAPTFWVGLMLVLLFSVKLGVLPVARMSGFKSYILPAFTWSLFLLAGTARMVRSTIIDALDSEYVKLARIKGLSQSKVVWKHCLKNAIIPIFTFAGVQLAYLLNGSVVVESIFAWPGIGRLIYQGIVGRDYPLVQGCLILVGFMIITISLIVDFLYSYIDPRIRIGGR
jgi:peptide/nickel transport system permease protein